MVTWICSLESFGPVRHTRSASAPSDLIILGTDGYIELRKYLDIARDPEGDHVYLVDHKGEQHVPVHGRVGFPFFGQLILDCLNRTDKAMSQRRTFLAIELALKAQAQAVRVA